jgi:hypothetical protein
MNMEFSQVAPGGQMATTVRKPRKKKGQVEVKHAILGPGKVIERRPTENGSDVLVVHFPDGETRTFLTAGQYWVDLNLAAIPITKAPKTKDARENEPEKDADVVEDDEPGVEMAAVAAD